MIERIGVEDWFKHRGHTARYAWAASLTDPHAVVNDIGCGIGYGSIFFAPSIDYHGYDRPGIPDETFPGTFHACDLNDPRWLPDHLADVTCCFETLEHVERPQQLARQIADSTRRAIFVSVPTIPTKHTNPFHSHDFTVDDIPAMFDRLGFFVTKCWAQPNESAHVWHLEGPG